MLVWVFWFSKLGISQAWRVDGIGASFSERTRLKLRVGEGWGWLGFWIGSERRGGGGAVRRTWESCVVVIRGVGVWACFVWRCSLGFWAGTREGLEQASFSLGRRLFVK